MHQFEDRIHELIIENRYDTDLLKLKNADEQFELFKDNYQLKGQNKE